LEAISKMELEEWMTLKLCWHSISWDIIWEEWLKIILNNLKLKNWVTLDLSWNNMPDRMKLKCKDLEDDYKCKILVD
jgi:hypothetical protein